MRGAMLKHPPPPDPIIINYQILHHMKLDPNKTYIIDGALGTELQRRNYETALPLWSAKALFDNPELVKNIHKDYILAGADIITTNTFRTQYRTLKKVGLSNEVERINQLATQIAVWARNEAAVDREILIAGSLTTLEDCYEVGLVPPDKDLEREHGEQAEILARTPIDFFLLETFNTIRESKAAAAAAHATGKPLAISFVANSDGDLLSGESIQDAVDELEQFDPMAYMINCIPLSHTAVSLSKLQSATNRPVGIYANGDGESGSDEGWVFENAKNELEEYTAHCNIWKDLGVQLIGGCCGTNPEFTQAYSVTLQS